MDEVAAEAGVTRLILYRNFAGKEELYRAVLERVTERLADALHEARGVTRANAIVASMLAVAREDPDSFRLLWIHARREPAFVDYAAEFRRRAVAFTEDLVGRRAPGTEALHRWSVEFLVTVAVDAVLGWIDGGDAQADDQFIAVAGRGLVEMVKSWAG